MGSLNRLVERAIPFEDKARLKEWEKSERKRIRDMYMRKFFSAVETLSWPLPPKVFAIFGTVVAWFCFKQLEMLPETAMYMSWMFLISLVFLYKVFIAVLLRYRGWLSNGPMSTTTKIWALLMKYTIPASTTPHCFRHMLPPLPFPNSLRVTTKKFVDSMRPVLSDEEIADLEKKAEEFIKTVGWKLQLLLLIRAMFTWNWFSDWWKEYVYLANRKPLYCSSVAGGDSYRFNYNRMDRLAVWIHALWKYFIEGRLNGALEQMTLNGTIPLCMSSIKNLAGSCRIPKMDIDEHKWSNPLHFGYIVITCKGHYYKVFMYDDQGVMLYPGTLKILLEQIWIDSNLKGCVQNNPAIFTTLPRPQWCIVREKLIKIAPDAVNDVEEAAFMVNLEDEFSDNNGDYYLYGTHGHGKIWLDKSMTISSFKSGRIISIFEHSFYDGLVMCLGKDYTQLEEFFSQQMNGFNWFEKKGLNTENKSIYNAGGFREPSIIEFGDLSSLADHFEEARDNLVNDALDIEVAHVLTENVDRRLAKKAKISPDGLIQTAIQAATYRMHKKCLLGYQPATLQHFAYGRTENIRPLTMKKKNFAICLDNESMTLKQKFDLLKSSCDEHTELTKAAMSLRGIDRHLFGLYVILKGRGLQSEFLDYVINYGMEAPMCTSCLPPKVLDKVKMITKYDQDWTKNPDGGVFRYHSKDGYGVFYIECDSTKTKFVVTCKRTSKVSNSKQFCTTLVQVFDELSAIMQNKVNESSAPPKAV